MDSQRFILRVMAEVDCPLFKAGDHMVLDLPGVDHSASSEVCALTVAEFLATANRSECESTALPASDHWEFRCPRRDRPVIFDVERAAPREDPAPAIGHFRDNIGEAVAVLRNIPIFRALPATFLAQLAQRVRLETYASGAAVLQKGHPSSGFYIIYEGELDVVGYAEHGVSAVMTKLKRLDCFGEMSLLTGAPCAATVAASGPVKLIALDRQDFELLLRENPFMASRFTRLLASRLMAANFLLVKEGAKLFSGKLAIMGLETVIQVLSDSARSGTLNLKDYGGRKGKIAFSNGRIYDIIVGDVAGEDALVELLRWGEGDFWLDPLEVPKEDKVKEGVMGLLLEAMRRIDEEDRGPSAEPGASDPGLDEQLFDAFGEEPQ